MAYQGNPPNPEYKVIVIRYPLLVGRLKEVWMRDKIKSFASLKTTCIKGNRQRSYRLFIDKENVRIEEVVEPVTPRPKDKKVRRG